MIIYFFFIKKKKKKRNKKSCLNFVLLDASLGHRCLYNEVSVTNIKSLRACDPNKTQIPPIIVLIYFSRFAPNRITIIRVPCSDRVNEKHRIVLYGFETKTIMLTKMIDFCGYL
uniref:Uncharacterized protein n=1 Tax=Sipha flava TaxID=143950 RepID=A0A2S2R5U0_9HEMI